MGLRSISNAKSPFEDKLAGTGELEQYLEYYGGRGLHGGGDTGSDVNVIDYITIASPGNATDFGDLTEARDHLGSCSNGKRGVFFGGNLASPGYTNVIDFVTVATTGNALDFGDLTTATKELCACSNGTRGVTGGGRTGPGSSGYVDVMDYVEIEKQGNATDFGDLQAARRSMGACASLTRGIFWGGRDASSQTNKIDYITIATTGNGTDFGDMYQGVYYNACCSDRDRGIEAGGYYNTNFYDEITFLTMETKTSAASFGDLLGAAEMSAACSDGSYAVWLGGNNSSNAAQDIIQYISNFYSPANAVDFGDLNTATRYGTGTSGD